MSLSRRLPPAGRPFVDTNTGKIDPQWYLFLKLFFSTSLISFGSDGIVVADSGAFLARSVVATSSKVSITNGAGIAGNIGVDIDQTQLTLAESQITNLITDLAAKQPVDADLTAIAALTTTSFGRSFLELANSSAGRTLLGLVIGTDVQAYNTNLAAISGLTSAADKFPYFTGAGTANVATITTAARTVLDDTTVSAMVDTLGGASSSGTGGLVRVTNAALVTPNLGTPSAITLTNGAGLLEAGLTLADNTTNNASTSNHGFLKKLDNTATNFMNGQGNWASPTVTGAALTKTDDTNVTATLGGSPTTALVNASSITLGWTGTLSKTRGGNGVAAQPAFGAYDSGGTTCAANGYTKINLATEEFDTDNYFTTSKFTPLIAGKYQVNWCVFLNSANVITTNQYFSILYKNGAAYKIGSCWSALASACCSTGSAIIDMNGSTDYIELYFYNANAATTVATLTGQPYTYMNAAWICP